MFLWSTRICGFRIGNWRWIFEMNFFRSILKTHAFAKFSQEKKSNISKLLPSNLRLGVGEDSHRFTDTKTFPGKNLIKDISLFSVNYKEWQNKAFPGF